MVLLSFLSRFLDGVNAYSCLIIVVLIFLFIVSRHFFRNYRLPPGPFGLPIVGYGPFLSVAKAADIGKLSKKFKSDILSINVYGRLFVVLNSLDVIREAFQKRLDLQDRTPDASFGEVDPGYGGVIGSNGRFWREHRRFSISVLRDFGMGRIAAERNIHHETEEVMKVFRAHKGHAFDPQNVINMAVSNVICSITFGKRFDYEDEFFRTALNSMNRIMGEFSSPDHVSQVIRMTVNKLPRPLIKIMFNKRITNVLACYHDFASFAKRGVDEHKKTYNGEVGDLIDAYLNEMEKRKGDPDSVFSERQVQCLITDLFFAGSETTYTTLRWALLYMAAYPDVQEKVYSELDHVIGPTRLAQMSDKKQTPFTEAVLSEVQRLNTLIQFGVLHTNVDQDVEMRGYVIPKNTAVAANLYQIHRDSSVWKNPNVFDPENFLSDGKVANLDKLFQFGVGRRACVGEALARMELYILFASWMKDFQIKLETDDTTPDLNGYYGGAFMPTSFKIRLIERYQRKLA